MANQIKNNLDLMQENILDEYTAEQASEVIEPQTD